MAKYLERKCEHAYKSNWIKTSLWANAFASALKGLMLLLNMSAKVIQIHEQRFLRLQKISLSENNFTIILRCNRRYYSKVVIPHFSLSLSLSLFSLYVPPKYHSKFTFIVIKWYNVHERIMVMPQHFAEEMCIQ